MAKSRKSKKVRKQKKGSKKETAPRYDTPDSLPILGSRALERRIFTVDDIPSLTDDIDLPSPAHLLGYTDSVNDKFLRVCNLRQQDSRSRDPTSLILCGFDTSQYTGDLDVRDVWVYPPDARLQEEHTRYKFAGYDTCLGDSESDAIILPMDLHQQAGEALTLHQIALTPAMLYAFRLFKDKPIWEMVRPIRENIIGNSASGDDWRYCFQQWRPVVEKFNKLRNTFNKKVRSVRDLLTTGLGIIKEAAVLMCQTQAFDWTLGEIILQDRMLKREYVAYRDNYDQGEDGTEFYVSDQAWLDIVKEDAAGEGDGNDDDYTFYICYRDWEEKVTWMFADHNKVEEMTTIWDIQQCTDPVVYIGDMVEPDTAIPWLPNRRKCIEEEPSLDWDAQSTQKAVYHKDRATRVEPVQGPVGPVPDCSKELAKEIEDATSDMGSIVLIS